MTYNNDIYDFYNYEFMELGIGASPNKNLFNYYLNLAKNQNQKKILEIGYGTGRLTTILLENKFDVIAIDKSKESKIFLEKKCKEAGFRDNVGIENIDVIKYEPNSKFNLIFAADEFIIHFLSLMKLELFLKKVNFLLHTNGIFVTDMRKKYEDEFNKISHYPIFTYDNEVNGIKHINCTSWNTLTKENIVLVHFKYEEINSNGEILKSYIRILKQGRFNLEELKLLAQKQNLKLEIHEETSLDYDILFFTKLE